MLLLGIDIGTTGAKAAVFTEEGIQVGYAFKEYGFECPQPGYAEQNAEEIWSIAKTVIQQAAGSRGKEIHALSLSVQGDAVIGIDKNRNALSPAYLGMDYRGSTESNYCEEIFGGSYFYNKTGMRPHPMNTIIKIMWIKNNMPKLYDRAYKFVTYADFLSGKLGSDELVIDYSMASRTMAFDLERKNWSTEILDSLGISISKLAKPVPSGTIIGSLPEKIADELGLKTGAFIVSGGHDQPCAALGAGIFRENMALDSHGTAEVISTIFTKPRLNATMFNSYYPCSIHTLPHLYFTFALNHTGGICLKWFIENFCQKDIIDAAHKGEQIYSYIFDRFPSQPSSVMVLPHFNGSGTPTCDLASKGAFLGLTMSTNRFDLVKSIVESLSYEVKLNLDNMMRTGITIDQLRVVGGGARSPIGLQNKADILGIPVSTLKVREAACLGAAMLAGLGVSTYHTASDLAGIVTLGITYYPDAKTNRLYKERFKIYASLYDSLIHISKKLF